MNFVAIARLATTPEQEAAALAARLGTHAYDERLKLAGGFPAVVLATPDLARAEAMERELRSRGHDVIRCRAEDVVASAAMVSLRRFRFDPDALVAADRPDARLVWSDIRALVRATHRTRTESVETRREKKFDIKRALVTGGLATHRTTTREVVSRTADIEPVLYVHQRNGPPWILREQGTHFAALGAQVATSAQRNFLMTVDQLVARSPHGRLDDRLVARKTSPDDADLLAHLIALTSS